MPKSAKVAYQDAAVADDLGLKVSPFTTSLLQATQLTEILTHLVFSYTQGDEVYYDLAGTWKQANGMRCKRHRKFTISQSCRDKLTNRTYNRWYFIAAGHLCPVHLTKMSELLDLFYLVVDPDHRPNSHLAYNLGVCPFIRKKPLIQVRQQKPTWGAPLQPMVIWHAESA